jgi:S1-C subfamily serine protease
MSWMFFGLLIFFICAGVFTAFKAPNMPFGRGRPTAAAPSRSYFGVNGFKTTEGNAGVTFANVEPPGSPADKAGLVGGDIITTVDGQPVHSQAEIMEILRRIPIGKTVDVVYLRDGEPSNTKLTTMSEEDSNRLSEEFADRPQGFGRFGYNDGQSERVEIPGTKMFGVRLNQVDASLPADMAGIKEGDIVIEFDKVPIRTPAELHSRVRRAIPYETVDVVVMRGGERLTIPVKMGKQA